MTVPAKAIPDSAALLVTVAENAIHRLDEIRLPLHILLENRFGDLNENQEELLGSARAAVDAIADELAAMRQIGELESGTRQLRRDRLKIKELVEALVPMLAAIAKSRGATIEVDVTPLLPPLHGDGTLLSSALAALLGSVIGAATSGSIGRIVVTEAGGRFRIEGRGGVPSHPTVAEIAAVRAIEAHRGSVQQRDDGLEIDLPSA